MRLTLRTLLSYLDDTLDPAESRDLGEKVAESDIAPELIERIAKVTRRRGLSSQAVIGEQEQAPDPNTVAEYLDNTLAAEQVAEVEKAALDSDAHLAEIAACHQILTLVLGEPAKVPPTARARMYRVVKGKESIPYRKSASTAQVAGVGAPDAIDDTREFDEPLLAGLSGNQIAYSLAGVVGAILSLIVVIYFAIPSTRPASSQGYVALLPASPAEPRLKGPATKVEKKIEPVGKKPVDEPKKIDDSAIKEPIEPMKEKQPVAVNDQPELLPLPREWDSRPVVAPPEKASDERRALGRLESKESLLLQRTAGGMEWARAVPMKDVYSTDTLMSLPGNRNELKLESGIRLQLWGMMPEFTQIDQLDVLESKLTLHVPPPGIDADLTLESGRLYITKPLAKGMPFQPARVRVRFRDEVWEITLWGPDTEVCLDLFGYYGEGVPFALQPDGPPPTTEVYFAVLAGKAGLKLKTREFAMLEAPTRIDWDSSSQERVEPKRIPEKLLEWWSKTNKDSEFAKQLQSAVTHYASRFTKNDGAKIDVAFYSAMQDPKEQPGRRMYALRSLQALDAMRYIVDALSDDVRPIRQAAIRCIQHWTGLAAERDLVLYRILIDEKSYTEAQARDVMSLLHAFSTDDYSRPAITSALFDSMQSDKLAVRELAAKHMEYGDPAGAREVGTFDPSASSAAREATIVRWKASWKRRFVDAK